MEKKRDDTPTNPESAVPVAGATVKALPDIPTPTNTDDVVSVSPAASPSSASVAPKAQPSLINQPTIAAPPPNYPSPVAMGPVATTPLQVAVPLPQQHSTTLCPYCNSTLMYPVGAQHICCPMCRNISQLQVCYAMLYATSRPLIYLITFSMMT
jgi:LSD1 subclass zinc finger protein